MQVSTHEPILLYEIESELNQIAPRRLRTYPSLLIFTATCAVVYTLILSCATIIANHSIQMLLLARTGYTALARISGCEFADGSIGACGSDAAKTVRRVQFQFVAFGLQREETVDLHTLFSAVPAAQTIGFADDTATAPLPVWNIVAEQPGQQSISHQAPITTFVVSYNRWFGRLLTAPSQGLSAHDARTELTAAVLAALVVTLIAIRVMRNALRVVHLLRLGTPAIATIVDKEIEDIDAVCYFVTYGFLDAQEHPRRHKERCTAEQWRSLQIGQPVTALFDPANPKACSLYVHLPMRCV